IDAIYRITEIYEFASRLAAKNIFGNDMHITVTLHGMKNRTLVVTDSRRKFFADYTCRIDDLPFAKTVTVEKMMAESADLALENIQWFFERFNWSQVPVDSIKNDQRKLLERRLH